MTEQPTTAAGPWTCLNDDYDAGTVFVTRDPQRSQSPLVEGLTIEQGTAIVAALNEAEARLQDGSALRRVQERLDMREVSVGPAEAYTKRSVREVIQSEIAALPPSAPPQKPSERLRQHILTIHRNEQEGLSNAEILTYHRDEHRGPGTIRNHDPLDYSSPNAAFPPSAPAALDEPELTRILMDFGYDIPPDRAARIARRYAEYTRLQEQDR